MKNLVVTEVRHSVRMQRQSAPYLPPTEEELETARLLASSTLSESEALTGRGVYVGDMHADISVEGSEIIVEYKQEVLA